MPMTWRITVVTRSAGLCSGLPDPSEWLGARHNARG
jgi:hypothetical protein